MKPIDFSPRRLVPLSRLWMLLAVFAVTGRAELARVTHSGLVVRPGTV